MQIAYPNQYSFDSSISWIVFLVIFVCYWVPSLSVRGVERDCFVISVVVGYGTGVHIRLVESVLSFVIHFWEARASMAYGFLDSIPDHLNALLIAPPISIAVTRCHLLSISFHRGIDRGQSARSCFCTQHARRRQHWSVDGIELWSVIMDDFNLRCLWSVEWDGVRVDG